MSDITVVIVNYVLTVFISCDSINCCSWSISHHCSSPRRTGVAGEWLQSCDGQTGTAGSGAVDDAAS